MIYGNQERNPKRRYSERRPVSILVVLFVFMGWVAGLAILDAVESRHVACMEVQYEEE
jgi:hypothetical protein